MKPKPNTSVATGYQPKTFLTIFCATEQLERPHFGGRVVGNDALGTHIELRCRQCGKQSVHILSQLPEGYGLYQVRVTGEDGPHLPDSMRPVPYLEEEFEVVAHSPQDTHEKAAFAHSLRFAGHLAKYYINGELHLDERF